MYNYDFEQFFKTDDNTRKDWFLMDFNTQRRAVSAINGFAQRHKLLKPVCFIAKLAVILFCSAVRAVDMAFSDRNGNFLGMKPRPKKQPNYDIPERKKTVYIRKRPFIGRAVSLVMALAFAGMTIPMDMGMSVFAAANVIIRGNALSGIAASYTYENPAMIETSDLSGVTSVAASAFKNNANLAYADLTVLDMEGGSADSPIIGQDAFNGASSLTTVIIDAKSKQFGYYSVGSGAFMSMAPDSTIIILNTSGFEASIDDRLSGKYSSGKTTLIKRAGGFNTALIPADVANVVSYSGLKSVYLKFTKPAADGFDVYEWNSGSSSYNKLTDYKTTTIDNDVIVKIPVNDTNEHQYAVRAFSAVDGNNIYSIHFTLGAKRRAVNTSDTEFTVNVAEDRSVTAEWKNVDGASYYMLYTTDSDNKQIISSRLFEANQTSYTVTGFTPVQSSKGYNVYLRTYYDPLDSARTLTETTNPKGSDLASEAKAGKTVSKDLYDYITEGRQAAVLPAKPTGVTAQAVNVSGEGYYQLTWDYKKNVSGYIVTVERGGDKFTYTIDNSTAIPSGGRTVIMDNATDEYADGIEAVISTDSAQTKISLAVKDEYIIPYGETVKFTVSAYDYFADDDVNNSSEPVSADVAVSRITVQNFKAQVVQDEVSNGQTVDYTNEHIKFTWDKMRNAASYKIHCRYLNEDGDSVYAGYYSVGAVTEFTASKLPSVGHGEDANAPFVNGTTYYFTIEADNNPYRSKEATAVTVAPPALSKVKLVPGNKEFTITWSDDDVTGQADGYKVTVIAPNGKVFLEQNYDASKIAKADGENNLTISAGNKGEALVNTQLYEVYIRPYTYTDGTYNNGANDVRSTVYGEKAAADSDGTIPPSVIPNIYVEITRLEFNNDTSIDNRGILIEWTNIEKNDSYRIYRRLAKNAAGEAVSSNFEAITEVAKGSANLLTYIDTSTAIENNCTYEYYVVPIDKNGEIDGEKSEVKAFTMDLKIETPANMKSVAKDGQITVTWDKIPEANEYRVYVHTYDEATGQYIRSDSPVTVEQPKSGDTVSFVDKSLINGQKKRYEIAAVITMKAQNGGSRVVAMSDPTGMVDAPDDTAGSAFPAPTNLNVTVSQKNGQITASLTWDKSAVPSGSEPVAGYSIYAEVRKSDGTLVTYEGDSEINAGNVTKYDFSNGLENGDVVTFKVRAYKYVTGRQVFSDYSSEVSKLIGFQVSEPTDFKVTPGSKKNTLKWTTVKEADGYIITRYDPSTGETTTLPVISKPPYEDLYLTNGVNYTYKIWSYVIIGTKKIQSDDYATASGKPDASYSPDKDSDYLDVPQDFTVTTTDGQANLSWSKVDNADGYEIYLIDSNGNPVAIGRSSKDKYTDSGLTNGTICTYTIRAYKTLSDGTYIYSDYATLRTVTIGSFLSAPVDVTATPGDGEITVKWSAVKGASGYVVYVYDAAQGSFKAVGVVSKTEFVHTGLVNGMNYTYMVAAYVTTGRQNQYSAYSLAVSAVPMAADDGSGNGNGSDTVSGYKIYIVGTTPDGISHTELITAYTDEKAIDSDVDIRFSVNDESTQAVYDMLDNYADGIGSFDIFPFDMTMYVHDTSTRVQPASGHYITLTMPIPDKFEKYGQDFQLMHITSDNQLEILPITFGTADGKTLAQVSISEFSPFAFVHYLTPEDMHSSAASAAAAAGSGTASTASGYAFRFNSASELYSDRKRNKIYKIVKK